MRPFTLMDVALRLCNTSTLPKIKSSLRKASAVLTLQAKTNGSSDIKAVVNAISTLVEEATFEAAVEGIVFKGMDPSHVALIDISWPASAFATYACDSETKFGVRVDELSKLVKRALKTDDIGLQITGDNQLQLTIGPNKRYKMRLIEGSASETPLPKIGFDAKVVLTSSSLDTILGDVQVVSEYLTISAGDGRVEFSGRGDSGEAAIGMSEEDDDIVQISAGQDSQGTYSLEYLIPVVKAVGGASEHITCEFSSAKPLRVGFTIANMGHIHFYLAPRVEN